MQFLSPWYLLGALAVAAPIIIHLARRQKVTVIDWAAHRFLMAATQQLQKRRRVEDLILLLLRCLLLLLLALLFARPFSANLDDALVEEQNNLVLLVDASASMGLSDLTQTHFDRARELVDQMLDSLAASTGVSLLLFADRAYPIIGSPISDHDQIRSELERQTPRPERSNLEAGLSAAIDLLSSRGAGTILVITDGQAEAWSDRDALTELSSRAQAASIKLDLRLIEGRTTVQNLGVVDFKPMMRKAIIGQPLQFRALVRNGGDVASSATHLLMELEPGKPVEEVAIPAMEPGEAKAVIFETLFEQSGVYLLTVRLPGDSFPADDSRTLGIQVSEGLRVGFVEGGFSENTSLSSGIFIRAAAVPVTGPDKKAFPIKEEALDLSVLAEAEELNTYDIVVLTGISELTNSQAEGLKSYLNAGGGLWINPPSNLDAAARFVKNPAIGEFIGDTRLSISQSGSFFAAAPPYNHSITGFWNRSSAGSLDSFNIKRYLRIEASDTVKTVLKLGNGDPLFVTVQDDKGRVFLSTLPMDREWSDLPLSAQFVPLVQRVLTWLSGTIPVLAEVSPGQNWSAKIELGHVGRDFYVRGPAHEGNMEATGVVERKDGSGQVVYSDTRRLGRHSLFLGEDKTPFGAFGVNLAAAETDLRRISADASNPFGGDAEELALVERKMPSWFERFTRSLPEPSVILAILVLALALTETYLANHFSRRR